MQILKTRYDLKTQNVLVLGDLNDVPTSDPIKPLYQLGDLHDVFNVVSHPAADRWTYCYGRAPVASRQTQIDYIFVSTPLKSRVQNVRVWRRGMSAVAEGDVSGITPLTGITGWRDAASDHAAISVELDRLALT